MANLVQTQLRAISAIGMREVSNQQAGLMYGYVWALIDVALAVLGLLILKLLLRGFNPPGLPPATYVLSGALPWFMWGHLYGTTEGAITRNSRLLYLPVFTELDFAIGASVQSVVTYTIALIVCTSISSFLEQSPFPRFFLGVVYMLFLIWVMGVSFGFVLMLLNRLYAPAAKFIGFFLRFSLFICCVYLPISRFPTYVWPYIDWIPMLQVEELIRQYWFVGYISPVGNPVYLLWCTVGMAAFGLLCERYCRYRLPAR
jgi:capsular polysaccharide transport system permease protein